MERDNANEEKYASSEDENMTSWISWFTSLKGNEIFCNVEESFIQDSFNLTGLSSQFTHYEQALLIILDLENDDEEDDELEDSINDHIEAEAETLYGLIHARFIITPRGLSLMYQKFLKCDFGVCPRVGCHGQFVLPSGSTDIPNAMSIRFYCPGCNELYTPAQRRYDAIDGAFFGTTFAHLFFLTYPDLLLTAKDSVRPYIPRVFGFQLHKNAHRLTLEAGNKELNFRNNTLKAPTADAVAYSPAGDKDKAADDGKANDKDKANEEEEEEEEDDDKEEKV